MNLANSVKRFTLETFTDPYGIGGSILGHLSVFDDEKSSGTSTRRRILETMASYTMFSTGCVSHNGVDYIVGKPNYDFHKGIVVRAKYPIIPCDFEYKVASILQILTNTVTSTVTYAFLDQTKNAVADSETSYAVTTLTAFFQGLESVSKGQILFTGSSYYRVKSDPYIDGAGFLNAEVLLLSSPVQTVTYTQISGYNPTTDTITNGTSYSNTKVFVEDAYYSYEHNSERYSQLKPGDKNITFKPSITPKVGDLVGAYKILTVDTLSDSAFSCHCRK